MQKCSTSGGAAWAALRIAQWHLLLETDEHLGVRSSGTTWGPGRGKGGMTQWCRELGMRMMLNLLPVATCRRCPVGQSACKPASWTGGRGVVKYEVSCDWSFQPPQYLAIWQEGLQLAEASFRDLHQSCHILSDISPDILKGSRITWITWINIESTSFFQSFKGSNK